MRNVRVHVIVLYIYFRRVSFFGFADNNLSTECQGKRDSLVLNKAQNFIVYSVAKCLNYINIADWTCVNQQ